MVPERLSAKPWINVENFSAYHNAPISTRSNGFGGFDAELTFNNALVVRHISQLAEWQATKIYDYGGRGQSAEPRFQKGECGIFIGSSATRADIKANSKFEVGYGMAFPLFVLAMGIVAALGNTVQNIILATAIVNFPLYARVARAEANVRRNAGFVQAARLSGNGEFRILLVHILPNIMPAIPSVSTPSTSASTTRSMPARRTATSPR